MPTARMSSLQHCACCMKALAKSLQEDIYTLPTSDYTVLIQ